MSVKKVTILHLAVAASAVTGQIRAQELGMEYITEWQTDFKGGYNWANLLTLSASMPLSSRFSIEGSTISVAKTRGEPLIDDVLGYSNIEEDNLPLALATLGAEIRFGRSSLYMGIRNVNEDYFTSPATSFFVNSSCGIFPTLSCNYDIANYPLASWCVHYGVEWDKLQLQTSLYEGQGHRRLTGHDNVFTLNIGRHGIFSITSAEYNNNDNHYSVGCAVYYGVCGCDAHGMADEAAPSSRQARRKVSAAPWINVEHNISSRWRLMVQGSYSSADYCKYYMGVGAVFTMQRIQLGLFSCLAGFDDYKEGIAELTCRIPVLPKLHLQPAYEMVIRDRRIDNVGMMRLIFEM